MRREIVLFLRRFWCLLPRDGEGRTFQKMSFWEVYYEVAGSGDIGGEGGVEYSGVV